jgi:hypothetical protein
MRCEQCGAEFEGFAGEPCPRCGHSALVPPAGGGAGAPWSGGGAGAPSGDASAQGPPPPAGPPRDGPPWERQRSLESLLATLRDVLLLPTQTFRRASQRAGIGPALLYGMVLGLVGGYAGLFWEYLARSVMGGESLPPRWAGMLPPEMQDALMQSQGPIFLIVYAFCMPFLVAIALFVWSAIVHLFLMMFGGARQGYESTFRTIAYAYGSTALFAIVPICGGLVGGIWSLVVQILGLKEMHETSGGKTAAAVLLPLVLCCCACAGFVAMVMALGGLAAVSGR